MRSGERVTGIGKPLSDWKLEDGDTLRLDWAAVREEDTLQGSVRLVEPRISPDSRLRVAFSRDLRWRSSKTKVEVRKVGTLGFPPTWERISVTMTLDMAESELELAPREPWPAWSNFKLYLVEGSFTRLSRLEAAIRARATRAEQPGELPTQAREALAAFNKRRLLGSFHSTNRTVGDACLHFSTYGRPVQATVPLHRSLVRSPDECLSIAMPMGCSGLAALRRAVVGPVVQRLAQVIAARGVKEAVGDGSAAEALIELRRELRRIERDAAERRRRLRPKSAAPEPSAAAEPDASGAEAAAAALAASEAQAGARAGAAARARLHFAPSGSVLRKPIDAARAKLPRSTRERHPDDVALPSIGTFRLLVQRGRVSRPLLRDRDARELAGDEVISVIVPEVAWLG
ncbi:hypothetical protein FNF27_04776 [Cafeteria roenbergensis]|uniref:Uncharacterized protein n=1 Tax=Cafeteria roenbergensis TaxID=33653 RepID=A0A5A8CZH6_CAFRO|nr:hypothetical protein FNF29_04659 [Cafeteria roenbergensis]KAA0157944.1 hypothetical protein FNF28_06451 [Cafeteria roenbergensis]KAA0173819.1 hypothetical protein FNF27_04776 [Cafeteria roenbergensis]|eukprot:KAA0151451.1 hypothetical protein FNF29_04659 [Cafeteria roenbergensis]